MKSIELEKAYDPKTFEDRIYSLWKDALSFSPDSSKKEGDPFVVVIPPPNVTGVLHLGHGLNNSLQDIIVRFHRMRGVPTLWVPGTDHAGIATQNVVERKLKERGTSRRELGREKFLEETWKVKNEHHAVITKQLEKIGASVDWSRERFTMDEGLSKAVREVFVTLYERELLYKGNYLVNWCTACGTALADDEVDHEETAGKIYHIRYYLTNEAGKTNLNEKNRDEGRGTREIDSKTENSSNNEKTTNKSPLSPYIEVATTRPETMLGDTAVAFHPEDGRYSALKGKTLRLPLTERDIPVVYDSYVDKDFGTGAVKITPAHDPNDWEVAKRHDLKVINILNPDGTLNDEVPQKYRGLTVKKAREAVIEDLKAGGFFVKEEDVKHAVGHCYRCNTIIEPFLSLQWFVKMKPLAEKALACWQKGEIVFYPKKWENTYKHWLENIKDWCVSRQLWWGHRIPAWTCADCGKLSVSRNDLTECPTCKSKNIEQDSDVLDTWFSSWLWPFSTLGWKESSEQGTENREQGALSEDKACCSQAKTTNNNSSLLPGTCYLKNDLDKYYPTTALITAYDIIFFWVARMIMAGLEFTGVAPFRDIYIHGLVRDKQGRKMSKSLGNGLDPLELVDEFGSDSMKFTLAFMCAQGQDVLVDKDSFKMGSKFANKIWNASRYILMNLDGRSLVENPALLPADKWIYSRLNDAAKTMKEAFLSYRYNDASVAGYEFFWNDFCDWYVEASKLSMKGGSDEEKDRATTILLDILVRSLKLLHPLLPFITEEIYQKLPGEIRKINNDEKLLINSRYPDYDEDLHCPEEEKNFCVLQSLVGMIRTLRSECAVAPGMKLRVLVRAGLSAGGNPLIEGNRESAGPFIQNEGLIKLLAGIGELTIDSSGKNRGKPEGSIGLAGAGFEAFIFVAEAVDTTALKKKFAGDLERDKKYIESLRAKLANEQFVKNAPALLVYEQKAKLEETIQRTEKVKAYLKDL